MALEFDLKKELKTIFGFSSFKGEQEEIINSVLKKKSIMVIMPTGAGKSLCFQLPALLSKGTALVVSPLIALMKNQVDVVRGISSNDGIAHVLNSSLNNTEIQNVKKDINDGVTKLLYVAPESLAKQDYIDFLSQSDISFLAVDEAHCISEWGHDFRPEYRNLNAILNKIKNDVPVIALTATATPKVQDDIIKNLDMKEAFLFKSSFNRPNLFYEVRQKTSNLNRDIISFIKERDGKSGIIYCLSRKGVNELAQVLQVNGINALPYHAGLDSKTRVKNQDMFLMEECDVIVATIAFGMGIDKPDVRFVIHHDIPKSIEGYYQETGRGGRDGREGNCITFYSYDDIQKLEKFMKDKPVAEQEIAKELLFETVAYAESSVCRHKLLLHYFGEGYTKESCGACDNCLNPKEKFEGKEHIILMLKTVLDLKEQFKIKIISEILAGKKSGDVKSIKLDKLPLFGAGKQHDEKYWVMVIRQGLIHKLVEKEIENYGIIKLTDKGKDYINNPYSILIAKDHDYEHNDDDDIILKGGGQRQSGADKVLFSLLKDLRKDISRNENLPPFVIFQDPSLEDMTIQYPISEDELQQISGVGAGKAAKYGKPFLDLISNYVEENEITRPNDMVIKSVVNKSGLKVYIIQSIDRKRPLDDIAHSKNLSLDAALKEIELIVSSGTKLDISYYIDEKVDEYHQEEIFDYFAEAETDSIQDALDELGEPEFSEEEVRLMRIKFLSEVGN